MTVSPVVGSWALTLASRSPRRAQMLREHGYVFDVAAPVLDDGVLMMGNVLPAQWAASLAWMKARAASEVLKKSGARGWLVLGADTVVVAGEQVIGQPTGREDAGRIVRVLTDGEHDVVTGVALVSEGLAVQLVLTDCTRVRVGAVDDEEIERYLGTDGWKGKAGAYNLSERIEAGWPIEYEGDPTTVMGLPMLRLVPMLDRLLGNER